MSLQPRRHVADGVLRPDTCEADKESDQKQRLVSTVELALAVHSPAPAESRLRSHHQWALPTPTSHILLT
jgi:hypothetical protein